ncbi:hypothetical protein Lgor_2361 [Fluoribacter gormanii]|uniref:Uncharacterized protein n=1 Tax=Fluoribacter gormanii TaxID=464 RepID=A0A377GI82_9GAMM|nr:hypothetical protein Lgor_2361 [Fluoribacter gormanii]SIR81170.1 hypothetical protein SAMN05421777_12617 [Fluoribacter gormanii]STO24314.1 Uncharacterised protein [Fluoribacter gormanii]
MKKHPWFHILYSFRHLIAISCTIVGFFIIQYVALLLYIKPYQPLNILKLCQMLWHSNNLFLQMILIFNIFIKPLFVYFLVIFLFYYFKNKHL